MTQTTTKDKQSISYSPETIQRAQRALICSPFKLNLFVAMSNQSVPLQNIAGQKGLQEDYTRRAISERIVDLALGWLITVGLLRREVDGQGITDSFRLTPLGRQLVEKALANEGVLPIPSFWDRLRNFLNCWLRLF